ncbi:glycerol dehydratase reactivase beta/small subunit family protein [Corallococcus terminator]|uniref:PduH protein n=1 Tax=Corallococcus terminator TaxID=2316733 RepID=A0A3A8JCK8_9BACT|nr:glycerol dehydratase reactivase beta/small subunit family protein [Corallococcus terminator]RKG92778.1 PduH protein [Corallococcus terminator]
MRDERRDKTSQRPTVRVVYRRDALVALREVCAGLEEEGVPFECEPTDAPLLAAAHEAAARSRLLVGVAVAGTEACVHFSQLAVDAPVLHVTDASASMLRLLGQDAARLVKVMPLGTPLSRRAASRKSLKENAP